MSSEGQLSSETSTAAAAAAAAAAAPNSAQDAVLVKSVFDKESAIPVKGFDFNASVVDLDSIMQCMLTTGFQATNVGLAIDQINKMLAWRLSDRAVSVNEQEQYKSEEYRKNAKCTIFLSYTSNLISSGIRETLRFLVQHKLVDAIVTTAGGVEEDLIKCLAKTYLGDFKLKGAELRAKGVNRLGNLLVPNENYCLFEDWLNPILHVMTDEMIGTTPAAGDATATAATAATATTATTTTTATTAATTTTAVVEAVRWTPSRVIRRLGKEINNEESVYYWAYKNDIPVFCPALTDGSLGDMMYFHSYKRPEFLVDIVADIRAINDIAVKAHCTGQIILGGGIVKHHTCNANLMRNGADFSVYINTGQEFDGSDSGASPDEAISWGKIRVDAQPVKVCADASLVFPLIVSQTFHKEFIKRQMP